MNTTKTVEVGFVLGTPAPLFWKLPGVFSLYFFHSIGNAHTGVRLCRPRQGRRLSKK